MKLLKLLKNCHLFSPKNEGKKNLLFSETILYKNEKDLNLDSEFPVEVFDMKDSIVIPGFIDTHVHVLGGGGEKGPGSRTPEPQIFQFIDAGLTTVVGLLGTDSVTKTVENLIVKCRQLTEEGITAYMFIGSYRVPPLTVTGSVQKDLMLIEQCIGVGEIAISDHRSSHPSFDELARLASESRVGGMLSGKSGKIHVHMGDAKTNLDPLWEVVEKTAIPITHFVPTHMARNVDLIQAGKLWLKRGGWLDFTADQKSETETMDALNEYIDEGIPLSNITVSSDSFGSCPTFNEKGELIRYESHQPTSLLSLLRNFSRKDKNKLQILELLLPLLTSNPARCYQIPLKGKIEEGYSADLLVLDKNTFELRYVFSKGTLLKKPEDNGLSVPGTLIDQSKTFASGPKNPQSLIQ